MAAMAGFELSSASCPRVHQQEAGPLTEQLGLKTELWYGMPVWQSQCRPCFQFFTITRHRSKQRCYECLSLSQGAHVLFILTGEPTRRYTFQLLMELSHHFTKCLALWHQLEFQLHTCREPYFGSGFAKDTKNMEWPLEGGSYKCQLQLCELLHKGGIKQLGVCICICLNVYADTHTYLQTKFSFLLFRPSSKRC